MADAAAVSPLSPVESHAIPAPLFPAASIFHEPWWLDIATDGQWTELLVEDGGAVVRLRHGLELSNGRLISHMPTLIRTLGPEFFGLSGKDVTIERRKMALTRRLIEGLSGLAHFEQIFDHRVGDAATFVRHRDFGVTVEYAYRAEAGISEAESWSRMTDKVRNTIRSAARQFKVIKIDDAGAFCRFHDACLRGLPNHHGSARMARLVTAVQTHRAGQMLAAVDRNGAMVAALLAVWDADAVRNLIVARDLERCGNGALSLLLSHAMRIAERRGVAFDFDGAVTQGQLSFLSGFGAGLVQRLVVWRTEPGYLPARRNVLAINRA